MMKLLVLISLLSSSFFVQAESLTIYEGDLRSVRGLLDTRVQFHMDTRTAQGYVKVRVDEIDRLGSSFPRVPGCSACNHSPRTKGCFRVVAFIYGSYVGSDVSREILYDGRICRISNSIS